MGNDQRIGITAVALFASVLLLVPASGLGQAGAGVKPNPVTLVEVTETQMLPEARLFGSSVPWRRVLLSPRVAGLVGEVLVDTGDWVQAGDPILRLDARLADIAVDMAQAKVAAVQARHRDALRKRDELMVLKQDRHVSETAIETAVTEVAVTRADLSREQAELARASELRERHEVTAPFGGMVVEKFAEVGQWLQQDDPVVELVELDTLRIRATLPQSDYPLVRVGADARVRFDAMPDRVYSGKVIARVALGSDSSRSFPVLIDIDNSDHLLAPGMSARVWVSLQQSRTSVMTVPRDTVVSKPDGERVVWRVRPEGDALRAFPVDVETGRAQGDLLEVVSDELAVGDRVVLLGNERLRAGDTVTDLTSAASATAR
jgi:RND family efflux transporter MFP subunit